MRSQQQAERAEQQRIKNLVLNYDLNDDQHDGEEPAFHYVQSPTSKRVHLVGKGSLNKRLQPPSLNTDSRTQRSTSSGEKRDSLSPVADAPPVTKPPPDSFADETGHIDHPHAQPRADKSGNTRSKQRARKLQMGDMDWYGHRTQPANADAPPEQASLDSFVKQKQPKRAGVRGASQRSET